jgi:peptide/nickel transport system substrate-binding protein
MVRFDDDRPRAERPNGDGGAKTAYVDERRWIPVPDVATRAAQVETGELDVADDLPLDQYDRLARSPKARPLVATPYCWLIAVLHKKAGVMTHQKLRQAGQAAVDIEPIMRAVAAGKSECCRLDPSRLFQEVAEWHTRLPGLSHPERTVETARRLGDAVDAPLQPAGVRGRHHRDRHRRAVRPDGPGDPGLHHPPPARSPRRGTPQFDPMGQAIRSCTWAGWTCDDDSQRVSQALARETDPRRRRALWEQQTRLWYEQVPSRRLGDLHGLRAAQRHVRGLNEAAERPWFYNVWREP